MFHMKKNLNKKIVNSIKQEIFPSEDKGDHNIYVVIYVTQADTDQTSETNKHTNNQTNSPNSLTEPLFNPLIRHQSLMCAV